MKHATCFSLVVSAAVLCGPFLEAQAQQPPPQSPTMTFFVTGAGPGKGGDLGDLGGIEGTDRHSQELAQRAGAGNKTWRAYLSTQAADGKPAINAQDRIGHGPWQNFKGEIVAQNVDDLHSDNNKLGSQTSLTERGSMIPGVGYAPNRHDVLTGSQPDGRALPAGEDRTCSNWTSSTQGSAMEATSTAKACAMMQRHGRGIHRIPRAGRTAAAARPICEARVEMAYSIASPPIRWRRPARSVHCDVKLCHVSAPAFSR